MLQVILDVETKKTFDEVGGYFPGKLGISFVGVCVRMGWAGKGEELRFFEQDLPELFPLLERADVLVGFNIIDFDLPALAPLYSGDIGQFAVLDILARIKDSAGHRISLDMVAQETLGKGKSGDGLDAIKYYRAGKLDELAKYCMRDVEVTREVYDYGLNKGKVLFKNKWNRLIECPVDFSFTPPQDTGVQMSLLV